MFWDHLFLPALPYLNQQPVAIFQPGQSFWRVCPFKLIIPLPCRSMTRGVAGRQGWGGGGDVVGDSVCICVVLGATSFIKCPTTLGNGGSNALLESVRAWAGRAVPTDPLLL